MTPTEIFEKLRDKHGDAVFDFQSAAKDPWCKIDPPRLLEVCRTLRDDPALDMQFLENLTGVDYPKEGKIAVVYHFTSYRKRHDFCAKVHLDREDPSVETLSSLWQAARYNERECYDLLGVIFDGHPDLRRVLLPDDWEGHPLRKDFVEKDDYHGIPTVRPNPIDLFQIKKTKAAS
jgi:NADH-quinone oxidoreductase subunit C